MTDSLARLRAAGVSIWLDDLSRDRLISGSLAVLARDKHVSGVTTNPTIFARSIIDSNVYTGQLRDLRVRQAAPDQALRELTTSDVRCACDVLRTVYDATEGVDGRVSIEVDPRFAYDPERTVAEARTLWWLVDRPNLFVKIPAVEQGLPAISGCLAEGISINVTLIFSLARYAEVIEAFLTGLEGARAAGRDLSGIASVASFFGLFREFCDPGNAGCKMTRLRSRAKPARPYIWRLIILILLTVPSTLPELYGRVRPLVTACWSLRMPAASERRSDWPSSASIAVSQDSRSRLPVRPVIISAKLLTCPASAWMCGQRSVIWPSCSCSSSRRRSGRVSSQRVIWRVFGTACPGSGAAASCRNGPRSAGRSSRCRPSRVVAVRRAARRRR